MGGVGVEILAFFAVRTLGVATGSFGCNADCMSQNAIRQKAKQSMRMARRMGVEKGLRL